MILTINNTVVVGSSGSLVFASDVSGLDRPQTQPVLYSLSRENRSIISSNKYFKREIKFTARIIANDVDQYYSVYRSIVDNTYNNETAIPFTITTYETTPKTFVSSGYFSVDIPNRHTNPYGDLEFTIVCIDPLFKAQTAIEDIVTISQPGISIPFDIPSDIGSVGSSTIVVDNIGSVAVYADCLITGPGYNFSIRNNTTNQSCTLGNPSDIYNLATGTSVTISKPTVIDSSGGNRYNFLSSFEPFRLTPGINELSFTAEGLNDSNTTATLSFTPSFDRI